MPVVILKLGGSIITKKSSSSPLLDRRNLLRIASEIAASFGQGLILINGAGSYGHPIVKKFNLVKGIKERGQLLALAKDQALMNELNVEVCNVLLSRGVPAFPFQYSSGSVSSGRRIKSMNTALIRRMLNLGLVPVMFGTPSVDDRQGCSIISGDQIISFLSSKLNVSKVIFATNVDGVFDGDPRKDKAARILKSLSGKALARVNSGFSADIDVTGGMRGKIAEVLRMRGLKCQIINGSFRGNIKKALLGDEGIGTLITL